MKKAFVKMIRDVVIDVESLDTQEAREKAHDMFRGEFFLESGKIYLIAEEGKTVINAKSPGAAAAVPQVLKKADLGL